MSSGSFRARFAVSVFANVSRAAVTFLTGLILARGLSPAGYGDLTFLLGSFAAIRALLGMGTPNAFYTFIAQHQRSLKFYLLYCVWLGLQFVVTLLLVVAILPKNIIDVVWLGHTREVILLAFVAAFIQQPVWSTVIQIGESSRDTIKIQFINLMVVIVHAVIVLLLYFAGLLSITTVLAVLIVEYVLATIFSLWSLKVRHTTTTLPDFKWQEMLAEFWQFCRPLVILSIVSFLYQFADRWLLQKFGGAEQQGYYQIAAQFAAVSLLATTSITHIFWKEMAEASGRKDTQRMALLYNKVSRGLLMLGAVIACFMVPWAEQIVRVLLGSAYREAWPALAVMFLYPIHQSMGQVNATMFMASGQTKIYTIIAIAGMVASIPVTYLLLAPANDVYIVGMELGALGLALKMVGENVIFSNIQTWMIARINGWKYQWKYQIVGILSLLGLGYLVKALACMLIPDACVSADKIIILISIFSSGILYLAGAMFFFWRWPSIVGLEQAELRSLVAKLNPLSRRHTD